MIYFLIYFVVGLIVAVGSSFLKIKEKGRYYTSDTFSFAGCFLLWPFVFLFYLGQYYTEGELSFEEDPVEELGDMFDEVIIKLFSKEEK